MVLMLGVSFKETKRIYSSNLWDIILLTGSQLSSLIDDRSDGNVCYGTVNALKISNAVFGCPSAINAFSPPL